MHQEAHEEETCREFALAVNMIQRETQNIDQSQEDEIDNTENSGEACMFEIFTHTEDEEPEEELYESTSRITQPVLAFQQNPRRFGFQYQRRGRDL